MPKIIDDYYNCTTPEERAELKKFLCFLLLIISAVVVLLLARIFVPQADAAEIKYPANLWQGIIAEATSDGERGMLAVACCVRNRLNREMSTGLCGLHRHNLGEFCRREGQAREIMAKKIVEDVFEKNYQDITFGAINFECVERYGRPYWAKKMIITCKIGKHTFYKNGRR